MTTHLTTTPTLLQRIRDCQAVVVLRESTLESVAEDHEARQARRLGTFRTAPAEVLKGSDEGELTIRMLSIESNQSNEGSTEQPAWHLSPETDRPQVAFLVRENHTSWVPYFSSVFPLDGENVLLPDDVEDDRPDHGSLDLTELRTLITRSAEEAREQQTKLWEAEPEIAARTEPHPVLETPEAPAPGAMSAAPDAADPGGSSSAPEAGGPAAGPGAPEA